MRRVTLAVVSTLGLMVAAPLGSAADITLAQTNQVILSCSDNHSVILWLDSSTLSALTAEVASINTSGTETCTLDTTAVDPSSETTEWTVYDYNPSDNAIAPRNSPNSSPASTPDGGATWQFLFRPSIYTALFTTTDRAVTGDDYGKMLRDTITLSGDTNGFMTQKGGGDCANNTPAVVRFYFTSPAASGPSTGTPPAGFYTQFWWSDAVHLPLASGTQGPSVISETMTPDDWSDWNGQPASTQVAAFTEAAQNVQSIGLSFGGDCFFETGVTPVPAVSDDQFSSTFSVS